MILSIHSLPALINNKRGGIRARIAMAVVTLVVVGVFIVMLLGRNAEQQKFHYDNALTIAEYGLGEALMNLRKNPDWTEGFSDVAYNEGTYSVVLDKKTVNDTTLFTVESTGKSGAVKRSKTVVVALCVSEEGDSVWQKH